MTTRQPYHDYHSSHPCQTYPLPSFIQDPQSWSLSYNFLKCLIPHWTPASLLNQLFYLFNFNHFQISFGKTDSHRGPTTSSKDERGHRVRSKRERGNCTVRLLPELANWPDVLGEGENGLSSVGSFWGSSPASLLPKIPPLVSIKPTASSRLQIGKG
jgi:hypothetical protein